MPATNQHTEQPGGKQHRTHSSQVIYGLDTKKSYRGQESKDEHGLRTMLMAIVAAIVVAALVLGAAKFM